MITTMDRMTFLRDAKQIDVSQLTQAVAEPKSAIVFFVPQQRGMFGAECWIKDELGPAMIEFKFSVAERKFKFPNGSFIKLWVPEGNNEALRGYQFTHWTRF